MSEAIDIAARTRELISILRHDGVGGVRWCDTAPECEDGWSEDYAIVEEAYSPDYFIYDTDYFDHDRLIEDFQEFVRDWFAADPTVKVVFHNLLGGSNEMEVMRV